MLSCHQKSYRRELSERVVPFLLGLYRKKVILRKTPSNEEILRIEEAILKTGERKPLEFVLDLKTCWTLKITQVYRNIGFSDNTKSLKILF